MSMRGLATATWLLPSAHAMGFLLIGCHLNPLCGKRSHSRTGCSESIDETTAASGCASKFIKLAEALAVGVTVSGSAAELVSNGELATVWRVTQI